MKLFIIAGIFFMIGGSNVQSQELGEIKIGDQIWADKNISIDVSGSWDYMDNPSNSLLYGKLYDFEAAKKIQNQYKGWRLPTQQDFEILEHYLKSKNPNLEIRDLIIYGGISNLDLMLSGMYSEDGFDYLGITKIHYDGLGKDGHYWLNNGMYICLNNREFVDFTSSGASFDKTTGGYKKHNDGCSIRLIKE